MKQEVAEVLTAGRVRTGPYGTVDEEGLQGAFFVVCPETGRVLRIIASDGRDWSEEGLPPPVWEHVSVSLAKEGPARCPSWPEMVFVKRLFWDDDETVLQFHPRVESYVNRHAGCLHLWRPVGVELPVPPVECV